MTAMIDRRTDGTHVDVWLRELREQIDEVNRTIMRAVNERAALVAQVHQLKIVADVPQRDFSREEEILARVSRESRGTVDPAAIREIFRLILDRMPSREHAGVGTAGAAS